MGPQLFVTQRQFVEIIVVERRTRMSRGTDDFERGVQQRGPSSGLSFPLVWCYFRVTVCSSFLVNAEGISSSTLPSSQKWRRPRLQLVYPPFLSTAHQSVCIRGLSTYRYFSCVILAVPLVIINGQQTVREIASSTQNTSYRLFFLSDDSCKLIIVALPGFNLPTRAALNTFFEGFHKKSKIFYFYISMKPKKTEKNRV